MSQMSAADFDAEERAERGEDEYRPFCGLTLVALVLALLSLSAWLHMGLWFVSLFGTLVAVAALRRIARSDPPMVGRKLALFSLFLSLLCAVGTPVNWGVHRELIRREGRQFANYWFELQLNRCIAKSAELLKHPPVVSRTSTGTSETKDEQAESLLNAYRDRPEVQALQAVAGKAQVRYYDTELQDWGEHGERIRQVYAVTYDKNGTKTTFFIRLQMERLVPNDKPVGVWKITEINGGIKPIALGGADDSV